MLRIPGRHAAVPIDKCGIVSLQVVARTDCHDVGTDRLGGRDARGLIPRAHAINAEAMTAGRLTHRLSMQWAMMLTVLVPLRQRSQPNRNAVMR